MNTTPKLVLPDIQTACKDLEEYEYRYETSTKTLKKLSDEIAERKAQKQVLKMDIDKQTTHIKYYESQYINLMSKIEETELGINNAKLMAASNQAKVRQIKSKPVATTILPVTFVTNVPSHMTIKSNHDHLLMQKEQLQKDIDKNNEAMDKILSKLK